MDRVLPLSTYKGFTSLVITLHITKGTGPGTEIVTFYANLYMSVYFYFICLPFYVNRLFGVPCFFTYPLFVVTEKTTQLVSNFLTIMSYDCSSTTVLVGV